MRPGRPDAAEVAWESPPSPPAGPARVRVAVRAGVGLVLALLVGWLGSWWIGAIAAGIAGTLLVAGLVRPHAVDRGFARVGRGIGAVVAAILLTPFYWLVVTPLGWWVRRSRDPLNRTGKASTYWIPRDHPTTHEDLF